MFSALLIISYKKNMAVWGLRQKATHSWALKEETDDNRCRKSYPVNKSMAPPRQRTLKRKSVDFISVGVDNNQAINSNRIFTNQCEPRYFSFLHTCAHYFLS